MNALRHIVSIILLFGSATAARALTLDPASVPAGWEINDLSQEFGIKAQQPGAQMSLTFGKDKTNPEATVFVFVSKPLKRQLGLDVQPWNDLLVGTKGRFKTPASVRVENGIPHYRANVTSTSSGDVEMHSLLHAMLVENRIVLFTSEETVETYRAAHRRAQDLFKTVRVRSIKTRKN